MVYVHVHVGGVGVGRREGKMERGMKGDGGQEGEKDGWRTGRVGSRWERKTGGGGGGGGGGDRGRREV